MQWATNIYGPDIGQLKAHTTRRRPNPVVDTCIDIPDELLKLQKERSRGLQARQPRPVVRARGAGSPTDHRPTQNALLGLGCDQTTSMATEWGGWTWNVALTAFRRSTGPGPGKNDRERASRATMKILSRW